MKFHPSELNLPSLTAMQKHVVQTSMNLADVVSKLSVWSPGEIQLVIDEVNWLLVPVDELEAEAIQHLQKFLGLMKARAKEE